MALGGGTYTAQNKILNGTYINFVSAARASGALSDRGIAAMPLSLNWGADSSVFEVTPEDLQKNSLKVFGYAYDDANLKGIRDAFSTGLRKLYVYKLTSGGVKASCTYGTAKVCGTRGNDLKVVIAVNADDEDTWDVSTYLGTVLVDKQVGVASAAALVSNQNDFIDYDTSATLQATAGTSLTGGTNKTVDGTAHQNAIDALEPYNFNVLGVVTNDATTKALYAAFTRRMRDTVGVKFQTVLYDYASADYEGVISVMNTVSDAGADAASLVYWVTGAEASCAVNSTLLNTLYTGEYTINVAYTQTQLEAAILAGKFGFHNVDGEVRVLEDINTLVTDAPNKSREIFGSNQSVRVSDQIAISQAAVFNKKFLGKVPNDDAGRVSLWNELVKPLKTLLDMRALQDFSPEDVVVEQGETKNSVIANEAVTIVAAMAKLYMNVVIA